MALDQLSKIKLIANDGKTFEVDQDVAFKSKMVKNACAKRDITKEEFQISVVDADGKTLEKIIDYCVEHRNEDYKEKPAKPVERIEFTDKDLKYLEGLSDDFLLQMFTASTSLEIPGLLDIISQTIADMISEEIRKIYHTSDDLQN